MVVQFGSPRTPAFDGSRGSSSAPRVRDFHSVELLLVLGGSCAQSSGRSLVPSLLRVTAGSSSLVQSQNLRPPRGVRSVTLSFTSLILWPLALCKEREGARDQRPLSASAHLVIQGIHSGSKSTNTVFPSLEIAPGSLWTESGAVFLGRSQVHRAPRTSFLICE